MLSLLSKLAPTIPPSQSPSPSPSRYRFPRSLSTLTLLLSCLAAFLCPITAQSTNTISLSFLDKIGAQLGQPQTITLASCVALDTSSFLGSPTQGNYASVSASDPYAAMNLYIDPYCQVLASSAVGMWNNTTPVANVAGIRWEGTAPSTDPPGTLRRTGFPPGTAEQAPVSTHHSSGKADQFVMDPSKGKVVVALVSVVLVVGIVIGLCLVYRAAQYVPPPKEYSAAPLSGALLGEKKVKRKQAYYKKPSKEDQTLLANESMVENRGRSRLSVQQQQRRSRGELPYTGSVLIDIIQGDMYRPCQINPPSISQQAGGRVGEVVVPMHQLG